MKELLNIRYKVDVPKLSLPSDKAICYDSAFFVMDFGIAKTPQRPLVITPLFTLGISRLGRQIKENTTYGGT